MALGRAGLFAVPFWLRPGKARKELVHEVNPGLKQIICRIALWFILFHTSPHPSEARHALVFHASSHVRPHAR
jgi:hypothetical protein